MYPIILYRETNLQTLRGCIQNAGKRMSEKCVLSTFQGLLSMIDNQNESNCTVVRTIASACLGCLVPYLDETTLNEYCRLSLYS